MKKMKWLPAMLIAGVCTFTACSDDEAKGDVFSELTEEQHKENIEKEGIAMVQEMEDLANLATYDVIDAFMGFMDQSEQKQLAVLQVSLNEIQALKNGPKSTANPKALMMEKKRLSDEFKSETGIYEWDAEALDWKLLEESETEATFRFLVDGQDAEISVYNVSVKDAANQDEASEMIMELPLTINAHVKLGGQIITSFALTAEWHNDDLPKNVKEVITLEAFSFTSELTNTSTKLSASAAFKHNNTNIYSNGFELKGEFDYSAIMNTLPENEGDLSSLYSQTVLENANIWFQIGNIKVEGLFDFEGFMEGMADKMKELGEGATEADFDNALVELVNEYAVLYVRYADTGEIIAKGEFYFAEYEEDGYTYEEPALRMVFGDGSKVSVDDFFNNGFGDMIEEVKDMLDELEAAYGGSSDVQTK